MHKLEVGTTLVKEMPELVQENCTASRNNLHLAHRQELEDDPLPELAHQTGSWPPPTIRPSKITSRVWHHLIARNPETLSPIVSGNCHHAFTVYSAH